MQEVKKILSIAGSDSSGGAGIEADLKTIQAHDMFGMCVITSVTAQNTTGVTGVCDMTPEFVKLQIDAVFTDIFPDAVKIGMVSSKEIIQAIAQKLREYKPKFIVADPVMVATSGSLLLKEGSIDCLKNELIPIADVITPNIPEAEVLSGIIINSSEDMISAARIIGEITSAAILIKGGHLTDSADDLLYADGKCTWMKAKRINNNNTHGTGCTLSSAIACELAAGNDIVTAVKNAKDYVYRAIGKGLNLGKGDGPLWHNIH